MRDTWEWDGSTWTNVSPALSPPGLSGASMAFDSRRGVSVLFGGSTNPGANSSDTWEWDGEIWTKRTLPVSPPPTVLAPMTYDSARGETLLVGPPPPFGSLNTTWTYDGTSWVQRFPATSPPARHGAAITYDSVRQRVVMFGGFSGVSGRLNDTWEWDGVNWTQRTSTAVPYPRWSATMVFDSRLGKSILFGGDHLRPLALGPVNDTWEWDGNQWTELWPDAAPVGRIGHVMAYDSARGRSVMFGGSNFVQPQVFYTDTWELGTDITTPPGTPDLAFSQASSFRPTQVGTTSTDFGVAKFISSGTGPVTISSMSITGDFAISGTDCPPPSNKLAAGSFCTVRFNFTPTAVGTRTGTLTLYDDGVHASVSVPVIAEGLAIPTTLTVAGASAVFGGTTDISATLMGAGQPVTGAPIHFVLSNGQSATALTNASGIATWVGASVAGLHAGAYTGAIQATFDGDAIHLASSSGPFGSFLAVEQIGSLSYAGDFYVQDTAGLHLSAALNQRTLSSDPQFLDYSSSPTWIEFDVEGPSGSSTVVIQVTDDADWSTTGGGHAAAVLPAQPDGAYSVRAQIVYSPYFVSEDARVGVVSSPTKGGFVSGAGAIAADPSANTSDTHGYFSLQLTPGRQLAGSMTYTYRGRMDVGGGVMRDVDVIAIGTDVASLNGGKTGGPTSTGHFNLIIADASTGLAYPALGFSGGTFRLTAVDGGNKADSYGLALYRPNGSLFHATAPVDRNGNAVPATVVVGSIVNNL
jgi:hypothetical protein